MDSVVLDEVQVWRDSARSLVERAADLAGRLTLDEKIGMLMMQSPAVERLGIPAYDWWSEALHGVGRNGIATVFPQAIGLAATWNPALMERIADVISTEARAKHHQDARDNGGETARYQGLTLWSPNINLFRDPRWGRGQECYGEDVCLTARMGSAFVRGIQGENPRYLKAVATPKHFAVHNGPEDGRFAFDSVVSDRDLWEEELSAFEFVVRDSRPAGIMSAYNAINGTPCCANKWLLTDVLRGEWGFDGAVVGDVDNVANLADHMKAAEDHADGSAMTIQAGQDLCSGWAFEHLGGAVAEGLVSEEELDEALARNLSVRFRLGQFDASEEVEYTSIPMSAVDTPENDQTALDAARESVVLLKNDGVLPLDLKKLKKVAVLGPTADSRAALLGNYFGIPARPVNLLDGLKNKFEAAGVDVCHYRAVPLVNGMEKTGNPFDAAPCVSADAEGAVAGLAAEVYDNSLFDGEPVRASCGLDLFWNIYQPLPPIPADDAAIRWSGFIQPPASGTYTFSIERIGGFRLCVGDEVLLDELYDDDVSERRARAVSVELAEGEAVPVVVEYRQTCGEGLVSMWWQTPLDPEDNLETALAGAADADHIILCLGLTPEVEGEEMPVNFEGFSAGDRTTIQLPASQRELLDRAAELDRPLTVILTTGSAVAFDVEKADAILCAWYYGQRGGDAVAEILTGEVNPSGRLPITFYASDEDLPAFEDYSMNGRTYKFFEGTPLFAFGHGLSYTTFEYGEPSLETAAPQAGEAVAMTVPVTNTGKRDGAEVVQVYARPVEQKPGRPMRQLIGFARSFVPAGRTVEVAVELDTRLLRSRDEAKDAFVFDMQEWMLEAGPASSRLEDGLSLRLCLSGDDE
jgi:beta-glucosidase